MAEETEGGFSVRRSIQSVLQTMDEAVIMLENYRSERINVFAFIGEEYPYHPVIARLGMPTINSIRTMLQSVHQKDEIDDENEPKFVSLLLEYMMRVATRQSVDEQVVPLLLWPMVEHNLPEMKTITSIPERDCVFMRLTTDEYGTLRDSIYAQFSHADLVESVRREL